jgi:single-strand DNA-binding protein
MVNSIHLIGRVGKDPEVKTTQNSKVVSFSLATSETHKNSVGEKITDTQWHSIVIWGKLADVVESYVKKGHLLYLKGKVIYSTYDDKDGNKKYITEIVCNSMTMLSGKEPIQQQIPAVETRESIMNAPDFNDPNNDMPF